jgi:integrase
VSIHKVRDGVYKIRWRKGGREPGLTVHGSKDLAKKILRKKMSALDENRHLDIRKEINFRMSVLIDRYWVQYASKKKSADREKSILDGLRSERGKFFVRELADGTAIDQRERYLTAEEIPNLKASLDKKMYRKAEKGINQTFFRLRLIVPIALTTGMRIAEIFGLTWNDLLYMEELIAVRTKLKGGKVRYVPVPPELGAEFRRYPAILGEGRIFPPEPGAKRERQRVDKSFETILDEAGVTDFRFHDLRHTFSRYMMNGGGLYQLAKILGHSNIKMTERYAKFAKSHIAKTGSTARVMWKMMEGERRESATGTA